MFCVIGGSSYSGKTYLLNWIGKLTNENLHQNNLSYSQIKELCKNKNAVLGYLVQEFQSANVYPILVDEGDEAFFINKDFGQNLIVETTNSLNIDFKQYPTFIGTTNSKEYVMEERATSRTYYIKVDNSFDGSKNQQSKRTYNRLLRQTDTKLFKDFMSRYYQLILDKPDEVVGYNEEGYFDFLLGARQIFKGYYEISA